MPSLGAQTDGICPRSGETTGLDVISRIDSLNRKDVGRVRTLAKEDVSAMLANTENRLWC